MAKEIRGLNSIRTIRALKQHAAGDSGLNRHLEIYLVENNKALLEKELAGMERRKARIREKLRVLEEKLAELKQEPGGGSKGKSRPSSPAQRREKEIKVMRIEY